MSKVIDADEKRETDSEDKKETVEVSKVIDNDERKTRLAKLIPVQKKLMLKRNR